MAGRRLAAVVVLVALPAIAMVARPARAESVEQVKASIAALEGRVTAQAGVIHQLTSAYHNAIFESSALELQIATDRASLRSLHGKLSTTQADLRQAAILSYTSGAAPSVPVQLSGDPSVGDEYLAVASGDVDDTIDQLKLEQHEVGAAQTNLTQEQEADRVAAAEAAKTRGQALSAAAEEQTQLDALQSHLQQLQAQAAAAVAAAQAKAAEARAAASAAEPATQGAPVGNGLVSVVNSELSGSSFSAVSASPGGTDAAVAPPAATPQTGTAVPDESPDPTRATTPLTSRAAPITSAPLITSPPTTSAPPTTSVPPTSAPATTAPATTVPSTTVPPTTIPPTTAPAPTTTTPAASPAGGSVSAGLAVIRQCESSDDYTANTGNGYYGAYQFSAATWTDLGYPGRPDLEPPALQDQAAAQLVAQRGWGEWPACAAALGL